MEACEFSEVQSAYVNGCLEMLLESSSQTYSFEPRCQQASGTQGHPKDATPLCSLILFKNVFVNVFQPHAQFR